MFLLILMKLFIFRLDLSTCYLSFMQVYASCYCLTELLYLNYEILAYLTAEHGFDFNT